MLPAGDTTSRGTGVAVLIGEGFTYDIRQYMSYKIVGYALMNHINKDCDLLPHCLHLLRP
jgi:hypothetical protein